MTARSLRKVYGSLTAVDGINFEVREGEFFGVLGANGAGKSTTMRMVYQVSPVTSGELWVLGMRAGREARAIKARLGVVPQMDNLDEEVSVLDNLLLYGRYNGLGARKALQRARLLLEEFELSQKSRRRVGELSGGMKRRLTLARGLMNDPEMVILDEPTTGLDPQVRLLLWDRLEALRADGVTLIMTTHYMDEAERLCDRLVVMDRGRIVAEGSPRELVQRYASPEVVEIRLGRLDAEKLEATVLAHGVVVQKSSGRMYLFTEDGRALLAMLANNGWGPLRAYVRPGNLEDVFLNLTGRGLDD